MSGPQRTKSGQVKIEPDCPRCGGTGEVDDGLCEACGATGKVTLARHHELVGLRRTSQIELPAATSLTKLDTPLPPTDPAPPPTEEH